MIATQAWLTQQGVYQQLAAGYEQNGWIKRIGRGAFVRANDTVGWIAGIYSIQSQLSLSMHVAAKTALELKGFEHFVIAAEGAPLYLFSDTLRVLPAWFMKHNWGRRIFFCQAKLFDHADKTGLTLHSVGAMTIRVSAPERAMLEMLHLVPKDQSFEETRLIMEGLTGLRPQMVQALLERCHSIKAKRLFLYLAERCNHSWGASLDVTKIGLGSGNRVVIPGGRLDKKYHITVEREQTMEGDATA